jgi:NADPH-dependent 2,4-dienoyl-CoA reductase/sulfur reductase-like enzyme/nitrite reductase/ring-hydroxylating ferredoxin subunit
MNKAEWKRVARIEDLKDGIPISVTVDETDIFLVRLEGKIYAVAGECPHYGAPLCEGLLSGKELTCPWHHARFDITTGKLKAAPALDGLRRFQSMVEKGDVYIGQSEAPSPLGKSGTAGGDSRTVAILGAGAAGNAAAETLRREGFSGEIILITAENRVPYDRPTLSKDFLSGEAPAEWLPLRDEEFYKGLDIELMMGRRVEHLKPEDRTLIFTDGDDVRFDQLLLATGGTPRNLSVPGGDLPNVFLLRTMDDAESIRKAAEKAEKAVILGAGFIGLEAAASLRERDLKVELAARDKIPMQKIFGDRIGQWFQQMHEKKGVRFHLGVTLDWIEKKGGGLRVYLSDRSSIETDLLICGMGIDPAVDYLKGTNLIHNGAIPVDGCLQTKIPGIFAAGDIAVIPDRRTGEMQRIEHWVVAERQGQHAARAMLGSQVPYGEIPFFWTRQYGHSIKYIGYASSFDQVAFRGDVEDESFFTGYFQEGKLKAAASLEGGNEFIALGQLLEAGIPPSLEVFEDPESSFIETLNRLV